MLNFSGVPGKPIHNVFKGADENVLKDCQLYRTNMGVF